MNCSYCGCLLPDEYHPNCKQCGGPRKKAREVVEEDIAALRAAIALMCGGPRKEAEGPDLAYDLAKMIQAATTGPPLVPAYQPPVVQYYVDGEYVFTPPAVDNSLEAAWERIKTIGNEWEKW